MDQVSVKNPLREPARDNASQGMSLELQGDSDLAPLLQAASQGEAKAWSELVGRYARRVYALAKSRCRNHDAAEEITQSVFATVAEKLGSGEYNEQGRFESWLFRVASNRVRDHVRKLKRRLTAGVSEELERVAAGTQPQTDVSPTQLASRLRDVMQQLSETDREVVELRHHGGLSFKQISDMLGEPLGTLLARHHRALKKLKELLGDIQDEGGEVSGKPQIVEGVIQ